jgi:superfamily II DNA or RNA helicase
MTCLAEKRDYQGRLKTKTIDLYHRGFKSVLINSPTGSGKTFIGLDIVKELQDEFNVGAAWVAMRRNLLKQVCAENERLGVGASIVPLSMFNRNPPTHDEFGRPIKIVVLDESQHDPAGSMSNIYNIIRPKYILGMTATPFRTDRLRLSFDKVIRDIGIHQLIQLGYLSKYHQFTIPKWTVDEVVNCYFREPERWGKSVFYWFNYADAFECYERLRAGGASTELVTASTDRDTQLARFESGEVRCLVNMQILTEGFDSPSLKTVFVRDSQRGPTIQMCGRVFRKYPGIDYKQIVQSKMTHWPIQRTASPAHCSVWMEDEREWRSYAQSEAIEHVSKVVCMTLAHTKTEMPDFIKKHQDKLARRQQRRFQRNPDAVADTESGLPRRIDTGDHAAGWTGGFGGGAIIH